MPAAKRNQSDSARIELFLDMLAAERGGTRNTFAAYAHELADFYAHLIGSGRIIAVAHTAEMIAYMSRLKLQGAHGDSILTGNILDTILFGSAFSRITRAIEMAVSLLRRNGPPDAAALCPRT